MHLLTNATCWHSIADILITSRSFRIHLTFAVFMRLPYTSSNSISSRSSYRQAVTFSMEMVSE